MVKYLSFHHSSFSFKYILLLKTRAQCDIPLVLFPMLTWQPILYKIGPIYKKKGKKIDYY